MPPYLPKAGDSLVVGTKLPTASDPRGRCPRCNNLSRPDASQGRQFNGQWFALKELQLAGQDEGGGDGDGDGDGGFKSCRWCRQLARRFTDDEPDLPTMVAHSPDAAVYCSVSADNVVSVRCPLRADALSIERFRFQLYRRPSAGPAPTGMDVPTCPDLADEPGRESTWAFLRQCLMTCLWSHAECRDAQKVGQYPKRLLQLEYEASGQPSMRIVETATHRPTGPYVALSHCWGGALPVRSLRANIADFKRRVRFEDLSRVFQDCIATAQRFGARYVWADSICIVQDDEADWALHAMAMDSIYENAIFVVAAASSKDGSVPFLGPEAPNERAQARRPLNVMNAGGSWSVSLRRCQQTDSLGEVDGGHLGGRAWAWQERVLATRTIHFTKHQTHWECIQGRANEMTGTLELRTDAIRTRMHKPGNAIATWHRAVEEYARRKLTYPRDRLPALSGMAARFQPLIDSAYAAGLWASHRHIDLAWERAAHLDGFERALPPALANRVPSWSWASVPGAPVWGLNRAFDAATLRYAPLAVDCEPATANAYGEVRRGATARVNGRVVRARMQADGRGFAVVTRGQGRPQIVKPDCALVEHVVRLNGADYTVLRRALPTDMLGGQADGASSSETAAAERKRRVAGDVWCLLMFTAEPKGGGDGDGERAVVLVLTPVGPDYGTFSRIGLGRGGRDVKLNETAVASWLWSEYEMWEGWEAFFEGVVDRGIKIV